MVLVLLPVTVELYQTNVGKKTTASIPVWRMMMMDSFVNFWMRQADEHSKFEFRSQTGMFRNQKRILSNIWSGYTTPHPFLRKSSRCKIRSREEWRNRPIPRSASEVTTSILHSTRSSLWQYPFPQCNTSDVLLEWWGFNLWWISLWDSSWISWLVRGPVYTLGFLFTSGGQSNAHDFCDAFDQLRDKAVRGEILCIL